MQISEMYRLYLRFVLLALGLFPTLWGICSFFNNVSSFESTVEFAVKPMLEMADTYDNPALTWRAITHEWAPTVSLILITAVETIAGILGAIGVVVMLKRFKKPYESFMVGKMFMMAGCTVAILVWGVGFMVIAGDWFLSWQSKSGIQPQLGAMLYVVPCFLTLIFSLVHKE